MGTRSWAALVGVSVAVAAGCTGGSGTAAARQGKPAAASTRGSSEVPVGAGSTSAPAVSTAAKLGAPRAVPTAAVSPTGASRRTHPEPEPPAPVGGTLVRDWSTDLVSSPVTIVGATLVSVHSSTYAGFDRIVWEFQGGLPGYDIGYGEAHIDQGGVVRSPLGDADMAVTFSAATAHDQAGRATVPDPNGGGLPVLREYRITGDYHGYVFYALGLLRTVPFRVYELTGPDRLVVDFARR